MPNKRAVGATYEKRAAEHLKTLGYEIVEYTVYSRIGEIDIIAKHEGYLVFVEVKLRKSSDFAEAKEFVNYHKQNRLRTTAQMYLSQHPTALQPRFDVIEIYAPEGPATIQPKITHLENAFE